jgi:hypothetical protein
MGIFETKVVQPFPVPAEAAYRAALSVLHPAGFGVQRHDDMLRRTTAGTGPDGTSWGENITISVSESGSGCNLEVTSTLKVRNFSASKKMRRMPKELSVRCLPTYR